MKILTANDLKNGYSVYWSKSGWVRDHQHAEIVETAECIERLEINGRNEETRQIVLGAYLIQVSVSEQGQVIPKKMRERQRVDGPSIQVGQQAWQQTQQQQVNG